MSLRYDNPATADPASAGPGGAAAAQNPNAGHYPGGPQDPSADPTNPGMTNPAAAAGGPPAAVQHSAGPHSTDTANRMDPTVNPNGQTMSSEPHTAYGGGAESADRAHGGQQPYNGADPSAAGALDPSVTGPAPNTAGPHKKDILNKLDPRVDSNPDHAAVGSTGNAYGAPGTGYPGNDPANAANGAHGAHGDHDNHHQHHYGRDAAGAAALGGGAYEAKKHLGHNKNPNDLTPAERQANEAAQNGQHGGDHHGNHHLGRDAAGAAALGGGAYEANKHLGHHNGHGNDDKSLPPAPGQEHHHGGLVDRTRGNDPNDPNASAIPGTMNHGQHPGASHHGLQHPGRDAAGAAAAVGGAAALGEHEHHKHQQQKQTQDPAANSAGHQHTDPHHPPGTKDGHWSWRPGTSVPELAAIGSQDGQNQYNPASARGGPAGGSAAGGVPAQAAAYNQLEGGGSNQYDPASARGPAGAGPGQDPAPYGGQDAAPSGPVHSNSALNAVDPRVHNPAHGHHGHHDPATQGQMPPQGQMPQGQGQMPPQGQMSQGQGQMPHEQMSQGQMPPQGQMPHEQMSQGQMPPQGQMSQGQMPPQGQMSQGQMPPQGQMPQDQPGYGGGNAPPQSAGVPGTAI